MSEKQKWILVAALGVVLVFMVARAFGHHPRQRAAHAVAAAGATGSETPPASAPVPAGGADAALSSVPAMELARGIVSRPPHEVVIPARDLFAPGKPRAERSGSRDTSAPAGPPRDEAGVEADEPPATAATAAPPTPRFALSATFRDGGARMAILNGTLVREGDELAGGYVLREVQESRVTLEQGGRTLVVGMSAK